MELLIFEDISESCFNLWGYTREEMKGKRFDVFEVPKHNKNSYDYVDDNKENNIAKTGYNNQYFHKNGSIVNNSWMISGTVNHKTLCFAWKSFL